jgi:hypothetical protein
VIDTDTCAWHPRNGLFSRVDETGTTSITKPTDPSGET